MSGRGIGKLSLPSRRRAGSGSASTARNGIDRASVLLVAPALAGGETCSFALVETKPAVSAAKFELTLGSGEVLHIAADVESLRVVLEALQAAR